METANYPCTQQELYTISRLGWQSCTQNLPAFTAFKPRYTASYITTQTTSIDDAQALPSEQARNAIAESLRIQLSESNRNLLTLFQGLKRYITDAFPPSLLKPEFEAAGQKDYEKASQNNWDSAQGLYTSANQYITDKLVILTANQNMPPTFKVTFDTARTQFNILHQEFLDAEETATIAAETKVIANNTIYDTLINMFLDGQEIFRKEDAIRKQFTFSDLLYLVSGAGTAGVRGTITDSITTMPISQAEINIIESGDTFITPDTGKYQISPMASGSYTIKIEAPAYIPQTITSHQVLVGTISTLNISLVPIV